ncbi:conserved hypothetical protein [Hymenobacter gelipurpurascens]|uniref:DUF2383 domain-containing protein n=1 Tax=Hymenobacter gelipurpurascens TaxID=89968 RepID=A0A212TR23_9BACT|nr:PA2169 family four-helix-bundle protein [Hymenobacter gelipurpurascens]SNC68311.1 conserved hypothetical protein [Hymenobacter gelipurpurascens]
MNQNSQKTGTNSNQPSAYRSFSTDSPNNSEDSFTEKATKWLNQGSMGDMIGRLSTTQKVVGGALLVLGVGSLLRSGKSGKAGSGQKADALHELLYFVNDRIEGYRRAVTESQDPALSGFYKQLVSQSQQFANELNGYLREQGGKRQTSTTVKGKLYRGWMDAKAAITGSDEKAILGSNIYGEEWALKAYQEALADQSISGGIRQEVERQYEQSQKTYKELQKLQEKQA